MSIHEETYQIVWAGILEIRDKKVLMVREKNKKLLQLPGGSQKEGETNLETLQREINEELGVQIENPKLFTEFILPGRNEGVKIKFVIYTVKLPKNFTIGEEIEELLWVDTGYEKHGYDIGNPTKLVLFKKLKEEGLIN